MIPEGPASVELCARFEELGTSFSVHRVQRRFAKVRTLGRGRQGVVFDVVNIGFLSCTTRHAVKIFDPSLFREGNSYRLEMTRISRQVGILQRLYHPNLVQCEAFDEYRGLGVLLMELIEGLNLRQLSSEKHHQRLLEHLDPTLERHFSTVLFSPTDHALQPGIAFYVLRKMLRGLEVLHRSGYIHCDIKPSNIMLDRFGTVKLVDFGRATRIGNSKDRYLASPLYMAPEIHEGQPISPSVDLYSCGMVVLEMLRGSLLGTEFVRERQLLSFKRKLAADVSELLPEHLRSNFELVRVLQRLLAWRPEDRYPTAAAADVGPEGARIIHRQLARAELDTDYGRELESYVVARLEAGPKSSGEDLDSEPTASDVDVTATDSEVTRVAPSSR